MAAAKAGAARPAVGRRVKLSSGHEMPAVGLGTYMLDADEAYDSVRHALGVANYRLIDTAAVYKNEAAVGRAIKDSGVARGEIFVTTKLHPRDHGRDRAYAAGITSLERLGLSYVDLFLVHWPGVAGKRPDDASNASMRRSTWEGLQRLVKEGKARSIGVSNYLPAHLDALCEWDGCTIRPAVNQFEVSPICQQQHIIEASRRWGAVAQAYSSLAQARADLLGAGPVTAAAASHGITPAQVCLSWALARGLVVIPRSSRPARIEENAAAADLTEDELAAIDSLEREDGSGRCCWDPHTVR